MFREPVPQEISIPVPYQSPYQSPYPDLSWSYVGSFGGLLAAGSQPNLVGVAMESFLVVRMGRRLRGLLVFIDYAAPPTLPCLEVHLHSNNRLRKIIGHDLSP